MGTIRILFLAANPGTTNALGLDEESREIGNKIRGANFRDMVELITQWAVRPDDLLQHLNQYRPQIAHFSGHGSASEEIILTADDGAPRPVSKAALVSLFRTLKDNIRVVMLNACYSYAQAQAITEVIDCAIGMNKAIGDRAAITFAASFYRAIGFGRSVQEAFDQGKTALLLEGIPEERTPELHVRKGVDASTIFLVKPSTEWPAKADVQGHESRVASVRPARSTAQETALDTVLERQGDAPVLLARSADDRPRSADAPTATIGEAGNPPDRSGSDRRLIYGLAASSFLAIGIAVYLAFSRGPGAQDREVLPLRDPAPVGSASSEIRLEATSTDRDKPTPLNGAALRGTVPPDLPLRHYLKFTAGGEVRVTVDFTPARDGGMIVTLYDQDAKQIGPTVGDRFIRDNKRFVQSILLGSRKVVIMEVELTDFSTMGDVKYAPSGSDYLIRVEGAE